MEPENHNPIEELMAIGEAIDSITELAALKPVFFRLDEIGRSHPGDFDVQVTVSELKQRVVTRGTALKQLSQNTDPGQSVRTLMYPVAEPPGFRDAPPSSLTMSGIGLPRTTETPAPPPSNPPSVNFPPPNLPPTYPAPTNVTSSGAPPPNVAPPNLPPNLPPNPPPANRPPANLPPRNRAAAAPKGSRWGRSLAIGIGLGAIFAILLVAFLANRAKLRAVAKAMPVQITTTPPGAAIRINGDAKCTGDCTVPLVPGDYQVMAFLDGFEPAASTLKLNPGQPAAVNLTLQPQGQSLRVLTDLMQGQVTLDAEPPVELQDGQFVRNKIATGSHTVKITSKNAQAAFSIDIADAKAPSVSGPLTVKNLIAVAVATLGSHARISTSNPLKLTVNGQAEPDGSPAGTDIEGFRPGVNEITVGEGKDLRTLAESFGPAPSLTMFLKSDVSTGTLIISTDEDDTRVFVNGQEYPRKTQRGQLRIQTLGSVNVRVAKDGFEVAPPQVADVKKGSETRLEFKLQPLPRVAGLQIRDATPGAEVVVDQKVLGNVADDGTFSAASLPPGDHLIEVRRDNYVAKRLQRTFMAGKTVALGGADAVLASAVGSVRLTRTPPDAAVLYRKAEETQARELRGNQVDLPPGNYIFTARAPGYTDRTERFALAAGENHPLELALAKVPTAAPPPPPKTGGVSDFEDASAWSKSGDMWVHKGGGFVPFQLGGRGTYTFTIRLMRGGSVFRGGKIRWALQYMDAKNYDLFELDRKNLESKVVIAGKVYERGKYEHGLNDKEMSYTVQIDVGSDKLVHSLKDGANWLVLDTWTEPGRNFTQGKFAFLIQGSDEIGLTDFKFVPR